MITPFPSEELAKLVLGYLAEEQLMTAYDEFLQASPHLDATRNEYDRIFMTSLKRIMAEYRAAMIYVQNCKPILKDRLIKCKNILDIVKFLVSHVDINKLRKNDKLRCDSQNESGETSTCEVCKSLLLQTCSCKNQEMETETSKTNTTVTSTETTLLDNLPGLSKDSIASAIKKKHVKVMEKEANVTKIFSEQQYPETPNCSNIYPNTRNVVLTDYKLNTTNVPDIQKMELNEFLSLINNKDIGLKCQANNNGQNVSAGSFQEFYSGVSGTANANIQALSSLVNKSISLPSAQSDTNSTPINAQSYKHKCLLIPKSSDPKVTILSDVRMEKTSNNVYASTPVLKNVTSTPLAHTQTIYINGTPAYKDKSNLGIKYNYTKDEIMAMPTIIVVPATASQVTGTSQPVTSVSQKNQIITTSGNLNAPLQPLTIDVSSDSTDFDTQGKSLHIDSIDMKKVIKIAEKATTMNPHTIKIPSSIGLVTTFKPNTTTANITGLVKTVESNVQKQFTNVDTVNTVQLSVQNDGDTTIDTKRIGSLPKDNGIDISSKLNTPHVLPITRKASSTPRRSSHIRVLDFTTPRRILGDTIEEFPSENSDNKVDNVNSLESKSDNINTSMNATERQISSKSDKMDAISCNDSTKENNCNNKIVSSKPSWDAELRSLIGNNSIGSMASSLTDANSKHKTSRKKKPKQILKENMTDKDDKTKNRKLNKNKKKSPKKTKQRLKADEITEIHVPVSKSATITVKPNIKIISCNDNLPNSIKEIEKNLSSSNGHIDEKPDTPEMDRISLQSVIGSKLNISDLLETPFKQAIYDIQMETPRFLGPDLPSSDTPLSDIKIMNIPTPRFFESPNLGSKPTQATPSSYSSRPTDYSSGGSYYKPDDQDYIPCPEKLERIIMSSETKDNPKRPIQEMLSDKKEKKVKTKKGKPSRPVRRCTRNVSYYKSPVSKSNEEDNAPILDKSSDSDKPIIDKTCDIDGGTEIISEISKNIESIDNVDTVKKVVPARRGRPKKDSQKCSSKIQLKKLSPKKRSTKDNCSESPHVSSKLQSRKRMTSKEKSCSSPLILPAATKSRRKSSTPRKLQCSKSFSSGSTTDNSFNQLLKSNSKQVFTSNLVVSCAQDSDVEQLPLRWSDDGSQEAKTQEVSECDDISKIKDYIQKEFNEPVENCNLGSPRIKTGFDTETAKIIEKDLLDSPHATHKKSSLINVDTKPEFVVQKPLVEKTVESNVSMLTNSQPDEDDEDVEFVSYECNEDSENFITLLYDNNNDNPKAEPDKIKDKYCMEACIDDGVVVRLRVNQFTMLFEQDSQEEESYAKSYKETEMAVNSISNFEKLYTPLKESIKAQCYEIFDSTLTSLDTPLKRNRSCSPMRSEKNRSTVTEIVLEIEPFIVEKTELKNVEDKKEGKEKEIKTKRKRLQSGIEESDNKRVKTDAQYLLNSTNIQNMDIESVLSKLHGP